MDSEEMHFSVGSIRFDRDDHSIRTARSVFFENSKLRSAFERHFGFRIQGLQNLDIDRALRRVERSAKEKKS
jgi:hypothetical protein